MECEQSKALLDGLEKEIAPWIKAAQNDGRKTEDYQKDIAKARRVVLDCLKNLLMAHGIILKAPRIIHFRGDVKTESTVFLHVDFLESLSEVTCQQYCLLSHLQERLLTKPIFPGIMIF